MSASAQFENWEFDTYLPTEAGDFDDVDARRAFYGDGHGIAVDPDGKIWLTPFFATDSVQVTDLGDEWFDTRVIYVFNPDGTEASFSPVKFLDYPGGARDTLGGFVIRNGDGDKAWEGKSNRGLRVHQATGHILASSFDFLHIIDYTDGSGIAGTRIEPYCSATQATSDDAGTIYIAPVCPGPPIQAFDTDLNFLYNAVEESSNFSRSIIVSPDGLTLFETDYENPYTIVHTRPNTLQAGFDSVGVTFRGMRTESTDYHPITGNLWVSSGNPLNDPNEDPTVVTEWVDQTWYEFRPEDLFDANGDVVENPVPINSFTMQVDFEEGNDGARPRGLDFSPDGNTAYIATFGNNAAPNFQPGFQRLIVTNVANENAPELAGDLAQNEPNPFIDQTTIRYSLDAPAHVSLRIYDLTGRELKTIVDGSKGAGDHAEVFRAEGLPSGVYVYRLTVDGQMTESRRMLIMR